MEILNILYEYGINNKVLDIEVIDKTCHIILKDNKLTDIIKYEIVDDDNRELNYYGGKNILGEYDMEDTIYIFYDEIIECIKKNKYKKRYYDSYNLNNLETTMINNINILETILHETEHAKQICRIKDKTDNSIERIIYQYEYDFMYPDNESNSEKSISDYINVFKNYMIYNFNYNISFMERIANINSKEKLIALLKELGNDFKNVYDIQKLILNIFMFNGYRYNINGPTNTFLYKIKCMNDFKQYGYNLIVNDMSFEERYRYGFQITDSEYKKIRYK